MTGRGRGWGGHGHGRGFSGRGGWQQADLPPADDAAGWFTGRLPDGWFTGAPSVTVDRDEILVIGTLEAPAVEGDAVAVSAAEAGRITRFREDTRDERIAIAQEAEHRYGRKVAWGAVAGGTRQLFTTLSAPVMTRLRQPERQVLDTLVSAGVARSRSEALAWCVRLVGEHADTWLTDLRDAMGAVDRLRAQGPDAGGPEEEPTES
ncbi:MAG TPA: hypothetical protein VGP36_21710 [Mycobacteriales bacterium]|jgi:hypothetical protein|nr:hypothetical protein [Mycobacteriales bacterium]